MAKQKRIQLVSMRMWVQPLPLLNGLRSGIAMSYGIGCRRSSDPALLWLWCRPAAVAQWVGWESPYAMGAALKKKNKKKNANTMGMQSLKIRLRETLQDTKRITKPKKKGICGLKDT